MMEPVEQVILSVRQNGGERSVEVACSSELVRVSDAAEIVGWFSQDDTELLVRFDTPNLFFHPLPSGDFAIGLIFPSQAGFFSFLQPPNRFYVRVLVVPARTLRAFGNNPVALYRNLELRGKLPFFKRPPKRVRALSPSKPPLLVDSQRIVGFTQQFGPNGIATLVQSLQEAVCTFFASPIYSLDVIDALFGLFPVRYRTELTFASELMFSTRNPLRCVGVSGEKKLIQEQSRIFDVPLIQLRTTETAPSAKLIASSSDWTPWTQFVHQILKTENFDLLESLLNEEAGLNPPNGPDVVSENEEFSDLQRLAISGLRKLDGPTQRDLEDDFLTSIPNSDIGKTIPFVSLMQSAGSLAAVAEKKEQKNEPTASLRTRILQQPIQRELLISVDSCTARALFGDTEALETLKNSWSTLRKLLVWEDRERLREEFLALVHSMVVDSDQIRSPQRNVNFLDVLLVFLGE